METYKAQQVKSLSVNEFLNQKNFSKQLKAPRSSRTHGISRKEIQGSREPVGDQRLIQILDAMLQVPHIGKCVLAEAHNENPRHQHSHTHMHAQMHIQCAHCVQNPRDWRNKKWIDIFIYKYKSTALGRVKAEFAEMCRKRKGMNWPDCEGGLRRRLQRGRESETKAQVC